MNVKIATQITGGLSKPSKMPARAYNTPAKDCKRGSVLSKIQGSVCNKCYARKGRYVFPNVIKALDKRQQAFFHSDFVPAMVFLIKKQSPEFFRWFDSGDLQSIEQLETIVEIARKTPETKHWLPTRERLIVLNYLKNNTFPENLTVRISSDMIDVFPTTDLPSSMVVSKNVNLPKKGIYFCPSQEQGNKCLSCRACWDSKVKLVAYKEH